MTDVKKYLLVAIPVPIREAFIYLPKHSLLDCTIGSRVSVPFGNRELTGVVIGHTEENSIDSSKLRAIHQVLDNQALLSADLLSLCRWTSDYYCHPIGEVIFSTLPPLLRTNTALPAERTWLLTTEGKGLPSSALARSPKQQEIVNYLLENAALDDETVTASTFSKSALQTLKEKGLIYRAEKKAVASKAVNQLLNETPLHLTGEQHAAIEKVRHHEFGTYLLHGITGSGKTEIYLQLVARALQSGCQALVLIPEIGLSPQTVTRFRKRFAVTIVEMHSEVSAAQRAKNWLAAKHGHAQIVIGTRLSIFSDLHKPGIIIVDEEHDSSYKQQDGFRYSARDCAIYRARQHNIPVILGSATPSFESLNNAATGRYHHLILKRRAGTTPPAEIEMVDLRGQALTSGLSEQSLSAIKAVTEKGGQALVFLNRKGFASSQMCHSCGWVSTCSHCSASMTVHSRPKRLHCHQCDRRQTLPTLCPNCGSNDIDVHGVGTEQLEDSLVNALPGVPVVRIDRDSTRNKSTLKSKLAMVETGESCVLIGTQMLAKGHHFPKLNLVVIVDADQGFLNPDFRALEKIGQLLIQVAGRAGREGAVGKVLVQSHRPDHPMLELLVRKGYFALAKALMQQRHNSALPPYWHCVLIRAESKRRENAEDLLKLFAHCYREHFAYSAETQLVGPLPSPMEKINDRFRFQLMIKSSERKQLKYVLEKLISAADQNSLSKRVRWSIDIDPAET